MDVSIDGLRDLQNNLRKLQHRSAALDGQHSVSFAELFSPSFMSRNSTVKSFEELLERGGYQIETPADFEAIPDADWDAVVARHTRFSTWEEMSRAAGAEWLKTQLFRK